MGSHYVCVTVSEFICQIGALIIHISILILISEQLELLFMTFLNNIYKNVYHI